ncbi:conserved hypothetical protein [Chloroherpeton thalassium ATCC 35110]|uniref:Roadblock/LC7 family protein n=1 Tax=Chloroherpeton thalassium (strain ATCC 35110 / GB-78) TaxID=517418 RepID=B3QV63_CHLT3|nr:hypothetical protein [Chloroherpeton thalassium]ACF13017.1 conserved hypothetical protein [Chloroherpeton thalassium ATCC 35110]
MSYIKDSKIGQAIEGILANVPGTIAVSVVDLNSGMSLGSHSTSPSFDPDTASAYNAEVIKQQQKALSALQLEHEKIEDILVTLGEQLHLLKLIGHGYFLFLAVSTKHTNLAIARTVLRKYAEIAAQGV